MVYFTLCLIMLAHDTRIDVVLDDHPITMKVDIYTQLLEGLLYLLLDNGMGQGKHLLAQDKLH